MGTNSIIFIIESAFPYYAGGIETWLYNLSGLLVNDYNVTIIAQENDFCYQRQFELDPRIKIFTYGRLKKYKLYRILHLPYFQIISDYYTSFSIKRALNSCLRKTEGETTVVALNTLNASTAAHKARKNHSFKLVTSSRGPHAEIATGRAPMLKQLYLRRELSNLKNSDIALSNGRDMYNYYLRYGVSTIIMKNGVNFDRFQAVNIVNPYHTGHKVIVSVASLLDIKGIPQLIDGFGTMVNSGVKDVDLYLVGKGNPDVYFQQAQRLGVSSRVFFVGNKSDVYPYLKYASLVACLSGGGGFSMSALEAMATGALIVAWDTPVYQQFNDDVQTMSLVPLNDIEALALQMKRMLSEPLDYSELRTNAVRIASQFDWKIVASDFMHIIFS